MVFFIIRERENLGFQSGDESELLRLPFICRCVKFAVCASNHIIKVWILK